MAALTVKEILGDKFPADLAKLEEQLIWDVNDIRLLKKDDYKVLSLSKEAKKTLKSAAGTSKKAQAQPVVSSDIKSTGPGKTEPVSGIIKDSQQLSILENQLIVTLQDVEWLSEEDWRILISQGLTEDTKKLLETACGGSNVYGAVAASELAQYLKESKFSTDLLILDSEMIYTLEDVFRLSKSDWDELFDKRLLPEAQRRLLAALPPRPIPHKGPMELHTKVGSIIHQDYFFRDRKKCDEQMVYTMQDIRKMDHNDWLTLNLSAPAKQSLLDAKAALEEELERRRRQSIKPPKKSKKSCSDFDWSDAEEPSRGVDAVVAKLAIIKKRIQVLDRAVRSAHRLALRAEIEAIRRADDVAKLRNKRKQIVGSFKGA